MQQALLISYHFPPSSEVGALRASRLARLLPDFGYRVDVVCASLSRAVGRQDQSRLDLIPSSSRVIRVDTKWVLGRDPHRLPDSGTSWETVRWKARAYVEWLILTRDWSWNWGEAARRETASRVSLRDYHSLIIDAPPFPPVVPFIRWARAEGVPVVLDLRDVWGFNDEALPNWAYLSPRFRRKQWNLRLRDEAVRTAAHVVLTSPEMVEAMLERFPDLDRSHFSFIPNAFESVDVGSEPEVGSVRADRLRLVYTGSLAYGRAAQAQRLLRGMEEFRRRGLGEVELVLAGKDAEKLVQASASHGLENLVRNVGWIDQDEAVKLQQDADALLLLQPDGELGTRVAIPAKLFEYMARRRPILGMVGSGSAGRVIRDHGLGVVATDEDPGSLAAALKTLSDHIRRAPLLPPPPEEFSGVRTVARFAQVLDRVLTRPPKNLPLA